MKKFILLLGLLVATVTYNKADAQNINISINIGSQPAWGPTGYDYVDYYYMPEIDVYYNVNSSLFYYWINGYWMSARYLPYRYHSYDFYNMYKVVVNVHDPWLYNRRHRRLYADYRSYKRQPVIKYSSDNRYRDSRKNEVRWTASNGRTSVKETRVSNGSSNGRVSNSANSGRVGTNQTSVNRSDNNNKSTRPAATTQTSRVNNNSQSSRVSNANTQNRSASSSQTSRPARNTSVSNSSQSGRTSSGNSTRVSSSSRSSSNNGSATRTSSSSSRTNSGR